MIQYEDFRKVHFEFRGDEIKKHFEWRMLNKEVMRRGPTPIGEIAEWLEDRDYWCFWGEVNWGNGAYAYDYRHHDTEDNSGIRLYVPVLQLQSQEDAIEFKLRFG